MKNFKLVISSPEGKIYDGNAERLSVRGTEGELAVMAGHIPFITIIKEGKCKIELENQKRKNFFISGGILSVSKEVVNLYSMNFSEERT